jgi:anti-anti-sigma regulatory factor
MLSVNFTKIEEDRLFLCARGEMTSGHGVWKMHQAVTAVIGRYDMVLIDVSEVTAFDPTAVEMLVSARALGETRGTIIKLCGLDLSRIRLCLFIKLVTVFGHVKGDGSRAA